MKIVLTRDLNHFCVGCYNCIKDERKCSFYEEKTVIMKAIEEADLMIFTTPTYCFHSSGPMKSFLDLTFIYWMTHKPREFMFQKRAVVISTAAGAGAKKAVKDITEALLYWGVPKRYSYGIAVQAMNWDGVSDKNKEKINKYTDKLARKLDTNKKPHVNIKVKFLFTMFRMMQKGGMSSSKEEKIYWEEKGWLGDKRPW